jgi:hypothetical protein
MTRGTAKDFAPALDAHAQQHFAAGLMRIDRFPLWTTFESDGSRA